MDKELTIIAEPEELIAWADTFDILLNPSIEDAAILLNYMEGHELCHWHRFRWEDVQAGCS